MREMEYTVCLIPVLPADSESLKIRDNARQTFNEIEELKPVLGSIFMLDNNATDKLQINMDICNADYAGTKYQQ